MHPLPIHLTLQLYKQARKPLYTSFRLQHRDEPKPLLTEDEIELLTNPYELAEYKDAIMAAMLKGTKRHVESMPEKNEKGNAQTGQSHQK